MEEKWYWCMKHQRAEQEPDVPANDFLGPYASEDDARNWKALAEARDEAWKKQDEAWEGEPE